MTHVWVELNGKQVFVNDEELDPCEDCGELISVCRARECLMGAGCSWCGARTGGACRCDHDYEQAVGK
jgi:hypothetical protein